MVPIIRNQHGDEPTNLQRAIAILLLVALIALALPLTNLRPARADAPTETPGVEGDGEHYLGFAPFEAGPHSQLVVPQADYALPSYVDLSSQIPPVGNQGNQGSCVAWAVSYYYKSWQEKQEHPYWDLTNPWYQFSPSFVYNQINGGADQGSSFYSAFRLLQNTGDVDIAEMPYSQGNWTAQPTASHLQAAAPYRINSNWSAFWDRYSYGPYNPPNDISGIKTWLANRKLLVMGIPVYYDFPNFGGNPSNPYYVYNGYSRLAGGHGVCIVGYNDNANPGGSDADHRGGFLMVNSWGANWNGASHGYVYLSYDFVKRWVFEAWAMNDLSPDDPHINSVNPASGQVGEAVTIYGSNFGTLRRNARVTFNGVNAGTASFTDTRITATVPAGAGKGPLVVTDWDGEASNGVTFTSGFTVSASVSGGHGTVSPASQNVAAGNGATVALTPDIGYQVASITDNGAPLRGPYSDTFTLDNVTADHTLEVTFAIKSYTVSASAPGGHGAVNPASQVLEHGGTAVIDLTPEAGFYVTRITDNSSVVPAPYGTTYTLSGLAADHVIEVTFSDTYTISAEAPGGHGTVSPRSQSAGPGGSASISFTPDADYHIASIIDNGNPVPGPYPALYTLDNLDSDHTVLVAFAPDFHTVTATAAGGCGVSPSSQEVIAGGTAVINISPAVGYHIASITDNGTLVPGPYAGTYTISAVNVAHNVVVTFSVNTYTVSARVSSGRGSVSPAAQTSGYGSVSSVAITPEDGYHIAAITDNGTTVPGPYSGTYTVSRVTTDHVIAVNFCPDARYLYFAGGGTAPQHHQYLCIGNSDEVPQQIGVVFGDAEGLPPDESATYYEVPAFSRITIDVSGTAGSGDVPLKLIYYSDSIAAESPVYFNFYGMTGGLDTVGAASPAKEWYFAEGCTLAGFYEYVTVVNTAGAPARLSFRFQIDGGEIVRTAALPAGGLESFLVNDLLGVGYQTALALESDQPVVAARSMYFDYRGTSNWHWDGGSLVLGATSLGRDYYFAEGTTRAGFEEWLTVQNPHPYSITVDASYQLGEGQGSSVFRQYGVAPASRITLFVAAEVGTEKDVSVRLFSSDPFLAERPLYFDYTAGGAHWTGGTCVVGASSPRPNWFFAEGCTIPGFQEYLTLQNPSGQDAQVEISYLTQEGPLSLRYLRVPAGSRTTVPVNIDAGSDYQLSCRLSVTSGPGIIAERPMYFDYAGWDGGHDVVGWGF